MPRFLVTLAILLLVIAPPSNAQGPVRCATCGQVILGDYMDVGGRMFHREHFLCAYCGKQIDANYVAVESEFYHAACYQKRFVVVCSVCNKVILDHYLEDFWGNRAHASHQDDTPSCDFCDRFIAGGFAADAVTLPDGRRLCGLCAATSVTTAARARELAALVASSLDSHGIRVRMDDISFLLLGVGKMRKMSPDPTHHATGFTDYQTMPSRDGAAATSCNIVLLNGMPELQMAAVLAHEIMHVWLFRAEVPIVDTPWIEGSCEYASYIVVREIEAKESQFIVYGMETNADSTYGGGFRRVKQFVAEHGVDGWLDALVPPPAGE